jgi:pimeloyl-ACP methyl ester carboxylesterase
MTTIDESSTVRPAAWLDEVEFPYEVKAVRAGGAAVGYIDEGEGDVFLLLQAGQWSFVYRDVIPLLSEQGRVVAVDLPGVGLSPDPDAELALDEMPAILEAFVDRLGLTDIVLVTHDLSGIIGSAFAARRPELISGIVYANSFGWQPDTAGLRTMLRIVSSAPLRGLARATNWMLAVSASRGGAGRHWDKDTKGILRAAGTRGARRTRSLRLMGETLHHPPIFDEIERARNRTRAIPALTIFGERNDPFGFADRHAANHDRVQAVVVEKGNHFPMADDPELFASSIAGFAAGLDRG